MNSKLIFLILAYVILTSCNLFNRKRSIKGDGGSKQSEEFYSDRGGFGTYNRIPLVKPYQAEEVHPNDWRIVLHTTQLLTVSIHNVVKINLIDSIIIIYAKGDDLYFNNNKYREGWFVIKANKSIEKGFNIKSEYLDYLESESIEKEPALYNLNLIFDFFYKKKKIDWNTDFPCYSKPS